MRAVNLSVVVAGVLLIGVVVLALLGTRELVASDPEPVPEFEPLYVHVQKDPAPTSPQQTDPPTGVRRSVEVTTGQNRGKAYTYMDGDRTTRVLLQSGLTVQKSDENTADDVVLHMGALNSIIEKQAQHGLDAPPVFRAESGGGLMTLPGGVLLALDPSWNDVRVSDFFEANGIAEDSVSPLGFLQNSFFLETDAGFPSLHMANTLADQDGVVISTPNWWRETEAK